MKIILGATLALVAGAIGLGALSADGADAKPTQEYVVRADLRLCPSPLCGGYWIALANKDRTKCPDRKYRPRCYVASAWPASRAIQDGALVQGGIAAADVPGFEHLGTLIVTDVRNPVGAGRVRLVLSPPRHRRALRSRAVLLDPCVAAQHHQRSMLVSEVDLKRAGLSEGQATLATLALGGDGLFAAGAHVSGARGRSHLPGLTDLHQRPAASRRSTSQARRTSSSVVRTLPIASRST